MGETLILRHSHFFAKLPGDGKRVSWHQDASYWPLSVSKVASAWLALDDVDLANGTMQVIPGSHLKAQVAFEKSSEAEQAGTSFADALKQLLMDQICCVPIAQVEQANATTIGLRDAFVGGFLPALLS